MTTKLQPPVGTVIETGEEAITIPAGEMSWEEWQRHLDAMSARDGVTLVCNPGEYVDCSGIQVSIADLFVPHPFPITFQQDFTYTPVYPQLTDSRKLDKPPLYKGRVFHTWEELDEVVEAYKLTNQNSRGCFKDSEYAFIWIPLPKIKGSDADGFPLPWTLVKMPDVDGVPSEPPPEPLKYYVWVDGKPFPSKAHDARQEAVNEALRLSQKENKYAVVCTDIIKPVTRAEIVELEKG
jgi:hypothetical protein